MSRFIVVLLLIALVAPTAAMAAENADGFGLGIIVGEPTGLDAKLWLSGSTALQMAAAWSFDANTSFHFHLDYILHRFDIIDVESGVLPLYFGVGGRILLRDDRDDDLGIRIPVGLAYMFADAPFDVFIEVVPILDLVPDTDFDLNAALGGRFYF